MSKKKFDFIFIAGAPGVGKSSVAINKRIVERQVLQNEVRIDTTDMPVEGVVKDILSQL